MDDLFAFDKCGLFYIPGNDTNVIESTVCHTNSSNIKLGEMNTIENRLMLPNWTPLATKNITIGIYNDNDTWVFTGFTGSDGIHKLVSSPPYLGTYNVIFRFEGDNYYLNSSATTSFEHKDISYLESAHRYLENTGFGFAYQLLTLFGVCIFGWYCSKDS